MVTSARHFNRSKTDKVTKSSPENSPEVAKLTTDYEPDFQVPQQH